MAAADQQWQVPREAPAGHGGAPRDMKGAPGNTGGAPRDTRGAPRGHGEHSWGHVGAPQVLGGEAPEWGGAEVTARLQL